MNGNYNVPAVTVNSLSNPTGEDTAAGMMVGLLSVIDQGSEDNGKISGHILQKVPFQLLSLRKTHSPC